MWDDLADFAETAQHAYRRDVWAEQPQYLECWLEKDALSGIFEDVLGTYGVTLNVGRGYDGWDSVHNAAGRFKDGDGVAVLYFGDFDPSGEDMIRSLRERLGFFGCAPEVIKCALVAEDVDLYELPSDFTKKTDTRRAGFVAKYGDVAVDLDALPIDVLQTRLRNEVEARMDLEALQRVQRMERSARGTLRQLLEGSS